MHSVNKVWRQTRLYQTCILSILLYGSETWTLLQEDLQKLEVLRSQRMILGIRWHDFVRNTEVVDRTSLPCSGCHRRETKLIVRPCGETRWPHASSPRIITDRSSKNWLPFWSWLAATARTPAPFRDPADRRRYTLQHSCRMVRGSSSWPLWVDAKDLCCLRDLKMVMMIRAGRPMYVWCSSHLCSCGRHVCVRLSC